MCWWGLSWWDKVEWHRWVGPPWWWGWWSGHRPGAWLDGHTSHECFHSPIALTLPLIPGHRVSIKLMRSIPQWVSLLMDSPALAISPQSRRRADAVRSGQWWVKTVLLRILGTPTVPIVVIWDRTAYWVVPRWTGSTGWRLLPHQMKFQVIKIEVCRQIVLMENSLLTLLSKG